MSGWTDAELRELGRVSEVRVAGRRADGTSRTLVIVWHVVVDGALYLRSVKGPQGEWYKGVARYFEGFLSWDGAHPRGVVHAGLVPRSRDRRRVHGEIRQRIGNSRDHQRPLAPDHPAGRATLTRARPRGYARAASIRACSRRCPA